MRQASCIALCFANAVNVVSAHRYYNMPDAIRYPSVRTTLHVCVQEVLSFRGDTRPSLHAPAHTHREGIGRIQSLQEENEGSWGGEPKGTRERALVVWYLSRLLFRRHFNDIVSLR
jgi:hypothetical protein